jgi:hypothetical protein
MFRQSVLWQEETDAQQIQTHVVRLDLTGATLLIFVGSPALQLS